MSEGRGKPLSGRVPEVTMESGSLPAIPGTPWVLVVLAEPEGEISSLVCR